MCPHVHHWRDVARLFWGFVGQTLCLKASCLYSRYGSELCVASNNLVSLSKIMPVKYIALLAMTKIVPSHPHLVAEYQETILASVNDPDISIRMRALDLVTAMVVTNLLILFIIILTSLSGKQKQLTIDRTTTPFPPRPRLLIVALTSCCRSPRKKFCRHI